MHVAPNTNIDMSWKAVELVQMHPACRPRVCGKGDASPPEQPPCCRASSLNHIERHEGSSCARPNSSVAHDDATV
eukprot:316510-Amphidinium_carterae.1